MSKKSQKQHWNRLAPTRILQALPANLVAPPPGETPSTISAVNQVDIQVIAYGPESFTERVVNRAEDIRQFIGSAPVVWVNVDGLTDIKLINGIGEMFGLHSLVLEDVVHVHQRAKVEQYGKDLFIVARMVDFSERLDTEQVGIFLGPGFVLTFQERAGEDSIWTVRDRLRRGVGRIRQEGAGYLTYAILDAVIDGYFPVLDRYSEKLETLEESVINDPKPEIISQVHQMKTELLLLRRSLWPHREALGHLLRDPSPLLNEEARIFLRDVYDHSVQLIDLVETYRELCADLRDLHLSTAGHRMNEIMKVLTVISTIFIPLTFIAGVYGMNFNVEKSPWNMPELNWYFGYPLCLAVMAGMTIVLLIFFRRKGWLGGPSRNLLTGEKKGH